MLQALQIAALLLVATAWAFSLAHAAELPGKMRLERSEYLAVQQIYYPGFTLGGIAEPLAVVALAVLLAISPADEAWLAVARAATVATHLVYWLVTHPVNRRWTALQGASGLAMGKAGSAFFDSSRPAEEGDWRQLRDRWERSHLIRAGLMTIALLALAVSLTASG